MCYTLQSKQVIQPAWQWVGLLNKKSDRSTYKNKIQRTKKILLITNLIPPNSISTLVCNATLLCFQQLWELLQCIICASATVCVTVCSLPSAVYSACMHGIKQIIGNSCFRIRINSGCCPTLNILNHIPSKTRQNFQHNDIGFLCDLLLQHNLKITSFTFFYLHQN